MRFFFILTSLYNKNGSFSSNAAYLLMFEKICTKKLREKTKSAASFWKHSLVHLEDPGVQRLRRLPGMTWRNNKMMKVKMLNIKSHVLVLLGFPLNSASIKALYPFSILSLRSWRSHWSRVTLKHRQ